MDFEPKGKSKTMIEFLDAKNKVKSKKKPSSEKKSSSVTMSAAEGKRLAMSDREILAAKKKAGTGGSGGGTNGIGPGTSSASPANSGGGSGGGGNGNGSSGNGGSGIVIIRAPSCTSLSVAPGTNSTATRPCGAKVATFTVSGTLTIS